MDAYFWLFWVAAFFILVQTIQHNRDHRECMELFDRLFKIHEDFLNKIGKIREKETVPEVSETNQAVPETIPEKDETTTKAEDLFPCVWCRGTGEEYFHPREYRCLCCNGTGSVSAAEVENNKASYAEMGRNLANSLNASEYRAMG